MKTCQLLSGCVLFLWANSLPAAEPLSASVDLDHDGRKEKVLWQKFAETENDGSFFQLLVLDAGGGILWEGPKKADAGNPLVFGRWHFGISLPQLVADIDGDGEVELVAPAPQGDVSPTAFRVLRWTAGRFVTVRTAQLLESPRGSGKFPWSNTSDYEGTWVNSFLGVNADGSLKVELFDYQGGESVRGGVVHLALAGQGYKISRWVKPLAVLSDEPETPDRPSGSLVYQAHLGKGDHLNSSGMRLKSVGEILRQDRANYYGGRGDDEDTADEMFRTREGRERMDKLEVVPVGTDVASLREAILNGTPVVEVEMTKTQLKVRIVAP